MKTLKYLLMAVSCLVLVGCEDFLDVNTNQDAPITVTVDQALPVATFYAAQICYDHAEYGVYMAQALTTAAKAQTGSYPYSQGWEFLGVNRHPMWRRHFYDLGSNIDKMIQEARKNDATNYELIGRTIMLQSTMFTTDIFADMPRSDAYRVTSPKYDTQEEVYQWMFQEADSLVYLYEQYNAGKLSGKPISEIADRIYQGDMNKWAAYAKALRCRLYLRYLPNWKPEMASKIVTLVDEVLADPYWVEPRYNYPGGSGEQNCPWGPAKPVINAWESRGNRLDQSIPTTFFARGILGAYGSEPFIAHKETDRLYAVDPRASIIMAPQKDDKNWDCMRWLESNIGMDVNDKVTYFPALSGDKATNNPFVKNDGYIVLLTQEELLFIKAEAQFWAGDESGAYETTKEAVKYNMKERYGITTEKYDENQSPEDLKENNASSTLIRYKLFFDVKLPKAGFTLAHLMQQKYVAMYLQPEQWTDLRRYNYSSKTNGVQYKGVEVYTITNCHNGVRVKFADIKKKSNDPTVIYSQLLDTYSSEYALRRPYNLYAAYWDQKDCYTADGLLSAKAWVNRLNPDTETETKYNRAELERIGAFANGQVKYNWMQRPMIWQIRQGWNDPATLHFN